MITLALDAATSVGTVALFEDDDLIGSGETAMKGRDAERLMPLVATLISDAGRGIGDVGRIACGAGPGSFTSLRIAASIAKGLAVGREVPLFPLSSLGLLVAANAPATPHRYVAVLDALRGESYAQVVEVTPVGVEVRGEVLLVATSEVEAEARKRGAALVGSAGTTWSPHARGASRLFRAMATGGPVDLASWEPAYGRKAEAQSRWEATHGRPLVV